MAKISLNIIDATIDLASYFVSMQNVNTESICVVTGPGLFMYLKVTEDGQTFETRHSALLPEEDQISKHYTCHAWTKEHSPRLVICTADGDILLCQSTGQF